MSAKRTVVVHLTPLQAQAVVDALVDCVAEGMSEHDVAGSFEQTWGKHWFKKRKAAFQAMNRIGRKKDADKKRRREESFR